MPPDEHYLSQDPLNFGAIASFRVITIVPTWFLPPPRVPSPQGVPKTAPSLSEKEVQRYYDSEGEVVQWRLESYQNLLADTAMRELTYLKKKHNSVPTDNTHPDWNAYIKSQ